ncbi:uncharacterized protein LOC144932671 [Lampetra fluviatilis]
MESDSSLRGDVDHAFFSSDSEAGGRGPGTKEPETPRDQPGTGTPRAENHVGGHTPVPVRQVTFGDKSDSDSVNEDAEGGASPRVRAGEPAKDAKLDTASGEDTSATRGHKEEGDDIETTPRAEAESHESNRSRGSSTSSSSSSDEDSSTDDRKSIDGRTAQNSAKIEDDVKSEKKMEDDAKSESDGKLEDETKSERGAQSPFRTQSADHGKPPDHANSPNGARSRGRSSSQGSARSYRDSSSDTVKSRSSTASKKSIASRTSAKSKKSTGSRARSQASQSREEHGTRAGASVKNDSSSSDEEDHTVPPAKAQGLRKPSPVMKSTSDSLDGGPRSPRQAKASKKQDRKADIWQAPAICSTAKPVKTTKQSSSSAISSSSTLSPLSSGVEGQSGGGYRSSRVLSEAEDLNHLLKAVVAMETRPKTRRAPGEGSSATSRVLRASAYGNVRRPLRSNYSFSEEQVRRIDRDNQRLLERLCHLSLPPLPPPVRRAGSGSVVMVPSRPYHTAVTRERALRRIQEENMLILRRLEAVRPTPGLSRAELLLQYSRQAAYMGGPSWAPSSSPRRARRLGVHSSV